MEDDQIKHLIAAYERMAAEADAHADGPVSLAFRNRWTDDLTV